MKTRNLSLLRHASMAVAGLLATALLPAAELQNGGFDTANGTDNNAAYWASNATPPGIGGTVRGGNDGGFGWNTTYFAGGAFPTNRTFASTFNSTPVRQDLTGSGSTFVAGATYTVSAQIFSAAGYANCRNARIMWSLGLTADGTPVAMDHWFSDEFAAQSVANGGPIPNNHIIQVVTGNNGLTDVSVTFTATAAEAGKKIGIRLGGTDQTKYSPVTGIVTGPDTTGSQYYGMMDTITFSSDRPSASLNGFYSDVDVVDGHPITLSWDILNAGAVETLTLNDGTGAVNVLPLTDTQTGYGSTTVNPTANTTYTLTLDGGATRQVTILNGRVFSFTADRRIALAPAHEVTLDWNVLPVGATVTISDGTTTTDVTADTDPDSGIGSRTFTVPSASTVYTINVNNGSATATTRRVLRATGNSAAFSIDKQAYVAGEPTIATWSGTGGNAASWVGIYAQNNTPGAPNEYSVQWNYLNGTQNTGGNHTSGTLSFTMPAGNYYAVLFVDGNYVVEQGPIPFTVTAPVVPDGPIAVRSVARTTDPVNGERFTITWDSKADVQYDVYASATLAGDPLVAWEKVGNAVPSEGDDTTTFSEDLPTPVPARRFYKIYEVVPQP
ncbi:hypothetical protein OKA04_08590 [Luteolibacter flavescens]|uniref:Uncharacterized protein n=1 Tax=Luteolibacter flavescens TaxID=1859460 RepID=A0ABT3FMJ1_9BACT|nr:hypothetical protein [Luteolibacter flavescens]MCW1884783.1 hypothetical protein [Luteolibacter flavescens]